MAPFLKRIKMKILLTTRDYPFLKLKKLIFMRIYRVKSYIFKYTLQKFKGFSFQTKRRILKTFVSRGLNSSFLFVLQNFQQLLILKKY